MIHYITTNGIGNAWVANELSRLDAAGVPFVLHALRKPEALFHGSDWAVRLNQRTRSIYPLPAPGLVLSLLLAPLLFRGRFFSALINALFGRREHLRARAGGLAHLAVACHWARRMRAAPEPVTHIHSQWIHSCGTVAMYLGWLLGKPFSFTGHATDLFRDRCALLDKIERADFIVCISEFHRDFYLKHGARPEQCVIAYCGIDPAVFHPRAATAPARRPPLAHPRFRPAGREEGLRPAGGRMQAAGRPRPALRMRHRRQRPARGQPARAGGTARPGRSRQRHRPGAAAGKDHRLHARRRRLRAALRLGPADGDVDGLPQMLMEAMACGLPAVSTRLVGIPDLIRDDDTGVLVPPNDTAALADAIAGLMSDPARSKRLADAGLRWVHERFDLSDCLEPLIDRYRQRLGLNGVAPTTLPLSAPEATRA
jgi:glycosyltransferase involved in cell wall biosynthesis